MRRPLRNRSARSPDTSSASADNASPLPEPPRQRGTTGAERSLQDTTKLPDTYSAHLIVDLKKDKKVALAVQGIFVSITLVAVGAALLLGLPLQTDWAPVVTLLVTVAACLVYMTVHEATHGVTLQLLTRVKPSYKVQFPFLTTGNHAYLTRRSVAIVALAPAVIWGLWCWLRCLRCRLTIG